MHIRHFSALNQCLRLQVFCLFLLIGCFFFPKKIFAAGPWTGDASVSTANGGLGTRNFAFRTVNDQAASTDRSTWELDAGSSLTLYYKTWTTGAVPPAAPTTVRLRVYSDNGSTLIREFLNGTPPADGTTYTFFCNE